MLEPTRSLISSSGDVQVMQSRTAVLVLAVCVLLAGCPAFGGGDGSEPDATTRLTNVTPDRAASLASDAANETGVRLLENVENVSNDTVSVADSPETTVLRETDGGVVVNVTGTYAYTYDCAPNTDEFYVTSADDHQMTFTYLVNASGVTLRDVRDGIPSDLWCERGTPPDSALEQQRLQTLFRSEDDATQLLRNASRVENRSVSQLGDPALETVRETEGTVVVNVTARYGYDLRCSGGGTVNASQNVTLQYRVTAEDIELLAVVAAPGFEDC